MTENDKEKEKSFNAKEMLIEGCIDSQARDVISQMLERRLTELDPNGQQAKFVLKLRDEINEMPTCEDMVSGSENSESSKEKE
jgi:hypothetical protein